MAFAASIGEPPPTASTAVARDAFSCSMPAMTMPIVGSGSTSENTVTARPASCNAFSTGGTTPSSTSTLSVTTSTDRAPRSAIDRARSSDEPGPVNMNGVGAARRRAATPRARMRKREISWAMESTLSFVSWIARQRSEPGGTRAADGSATGPAASERPAKGPDASPSLRPMGHAGQWLPPPPAASRSRITASRLKEAGFCRGGNLTKFSIWPATTPCIR